MASQKSNFYRVLKTRKVIEELLGSVRGFFFAKMLKPINGRKETKNRRNEMNKGEFQQPLGKIIKKWDIIRV